MIAIAKGSDILRILDRVRSAPDRYAAFFICSPYIDESMRKRLIEIMGVAAHADCRVWVITSPQGAELLLTEIPVGSARLRKYIFSKTGLHAKAYMAIGHVPASSEALFGSANLTVAGVRENVELVVKATGSSETGSRMIREIRHFLERLAVAEPHASRHRART